LQKPRAWGSVPASKAAAKGVFMLCIKVSWQAAAEAVM
jgi:hypothetical protein